MDPAHCPRCGTAPRIETLGMLWGVACPECYDGAPDSKTRCQYGAGATRAGAVREWNDRVRNEDWRD